MNAVQEKCLAERLQHAAADAQPLLASHAVEGAQAVRGQDGLALRDAHAQLRLKNELIARLQEHKRQLAGSHLSLRSILSVHACVVTLRLLLFRKALEPVTGMLCPQTGRQPILREVCSTFMSSSPLEQRRL
jgi:hypothetical protein